MDEKNYQINTVDKLQYISLNLLREQGINHAFSTRKGGVSQSKYESLNLSLAVEDDVKAVQQNIQIFMHALRLNPDSLVTMKQVHSDHIIVFEHAPKEVLTGDAVVTNQLGVTLAVQTADCVPVLIADTVNGIVAAVHVGWRGAAANILGKTLEHMQSLGSYLDDCLVGIGPCIGPCCYQVDEAVINEFRKHDMPWEEFVRSKSQGHWWLDLAGISEWQAVEVGVSKENIDKVGLCTCCEEELFFSYRRDGQTGRMMSVIGLRV